MGNLTRDPELRYTPKGTAVAKVGLAVNRTWKTDTGETKEEVTFVDIDVFGRTAENVSQYLRKGSSMMVEGRLRLDSWEDKQTQQKRSKLGVVAETVQFIGGRAEGGRPEGAPASEPRPRSSAPAPAPRPTPEAAHPDADVPPHEEDDVPF